jgi:hypothetical protein
MTRKCTIVPCEPAHVRALLAGLREKDAEEIRGDGISLQKGVWRPYRMSAYAKTALVDGDVAACFGTAANCLSNSARPWLLTTNVVYRAPLALVKAGFREVKIMTEMHPFLENYVLASYTGAVGLLSMFGFNIDEPFPHKQTGVLFRRFWIDRRTT